MSARGGLLASTGSVLAAIVASACCWLPLLLLGFGVSAAGISAKFESVRPYFLGGAGVLLFAGFYLSYFRKPACEPDGSCTTPRRKLERFNRTMLWVATVLVLAVGLFPNYVGLIAADGDAPLGSVSDTTERVTVPIQGMTCEACAPHVRNELLRVNGVTQASVSYREGAATVVVKRDAPPSREALVKAVERAGYKIRD